MDKLAFIVPTGIGASIGGYAGDAGAFARKLSEKYTLIVNPNVVNAAAFSAINDNMLYVEGHALDLFFKKEIVLRTSFKNKIGIIFDKEIPENVLNVHFNTLGAIKAVYGIETEYVFTDDKAGINFVESNGVSTGTIRNPDTLIVAAQKLIDKGCNALAPVCLFEDTNDDDNLYENGLGIDIVGGVEAIISHILTDAFLLPCAHAPAFKNTDISFERVSDKAAAEYITPTFLPCVILGLYNAPQLISYNNRVDGDICADDLKGVLMPYNSLGSIPVLKSLEYNIPVYAVKENKTVLDVTKKNLNTSDIIEIEKYSDIARIFNNK